MISNQNIQPEFNPRFARNVALDTMKTLPNQTQEMWSNSDSEDSEASMPISTNIKTKRREETKIPFWDSLDEAHWTDAPTCQ